jgi:type II secretory pathway pseudopilin PulG
MITTRRTHSSLAAFTLAELMVAVAILAVVGILVASVTVTETWLYAKNTALNTSHRAARRALDRLANELQLSQSLPSLIDASGNLAATATAAGVSYDRLVGAPYKVEHPGGPGLKAGDTKVTVTRSTNFLASPPLPQAGDVLSLDQPTGSPVRAQVSSVRITKTDAAKARQTMDLTLTAPLGTDISWDATQPKTAPIVRREAFIVVPSGARNELRFYQTFEPKPTISDPTAYVVVTAEISTVKLPDGTRRDVNPFSIDNSTGDKLVKANLRLQAPDYLNSLASRQANSFNTFVQIDATFPSRLRPKS